MSVCEPPYELWAPAIKELLTLSFDLRSLTDKMMKGISFKFTVKISVDYQPSRTSAKPYWCIYNCWFLLCYYGLREAFGVDICKINIPQYSNIKWIETMKLRDSNQILCNRLTEQTTLKSVRKKYTQHRYKRRNHRTSDIEI